MGARGRGCSGSRARKGRVRERGNHGNQFLFPVCQALANLETALNTDSNCEKAWYVRPGACGSYSQTGCMDKQTRPVHSCSPGDSLGLKGALAAPGSQCQHAAVAPGQPTQPSLSPAIRYSLGSTTGPHGGL